VPGWDSLAQIGVLAAPEIRFGVEIRAAEADRLSSFGDLVDLILQKRPHLP
jgi:acyl carrier protein